jgi:glyoxylase-like metal-dependent hydrolase (beta-lactamase superfamily II)
MRKRLFGATAAASIATLAIVASGARTAPRAQGRDTGEIEVLPVHGSLYMIAGGGANIAASVGKDGVLLVDSGAAPMTDKVLAAIRQLQNEVARREPQPELKWGAETRGTLQSSLNHIAPPKPIRYIVNTSADPDHVGGNGTLVKAGKTFTGGNVAGDIADAGQGAAVLAYEKVLTRVSAPTGERSTLPSDAWPTDTFFQSSMKLSHFFNGDGVQIIHIPAAHTDGDSIVYFRHSDVIATGDIFDMNHYPVIDVEKGGSINGVVDGLNAVLDLVIPEFRMEGGTMVVPGHGRLCDGGDVAYYRDMVTIIRDRIQDMMIKKGMTLEQVKAAKPTADYDPRWSTKEYSSDMFIEAAYKSLVPKKSAPAKTTPPAKKKN